MKLNNALKTLITVVCIVILGTLFLLFHEKKSGDEIITENLSEETEDSANDKEVVTNQKIYIHIYGAVKKPGVYKFEQEPRACEVIEKAGGFTKKADQASVNLAMTVTDGTQLFVEKKGKKKTTSEQSEEDGKINLNTATKEELMKIPGVGESKATQIISYREQQGRFQTIEDIMKITGIKQGIFNKLRDYIKV